MRRTLIGSVAVVLGLGALVATGAGASGQGSPPELRPVPVQGKLIAPGVKLTVHVFPAAHAPGKGRGGPKGPPSPSDDICTDGDQGTYSLFAKAKQGGMTFKLDNTFAPSALQGTAPAAIGAAFDAWDGAIGGNYFDVQRDDAAPAAPSKDGVNVVGWAKLRPKNTLAAAWTYTDAATGRVLQADVFFNTGHSWGVLSGCNAAAAFDIQNIATHEVGHVLALEHVSDTAKVATMYPSAPSGEIKKRTLTAGDVAGVTASLQ